MRRWGLVLAPFLALSSACAATLEPAAPPEPVSHPVPAAPEVSESPPEEAPAAWLGAAPSQSVIVPGTGEPVWVGVWIGVPEEAPRAARPPMSLALVVDTSGSMSGAKIENARLAAVSLLEGVKQGDVVSIDAFSDRVRTLAAPTPVGPGTMGPLVDAVRGLEAAGGTNLFDGLRAGVEHAAAARSHPLRRAIVISDGRANVGPATPDALGDLAAWGTEDGVQVSAIGVGLDYDERTLGELARRSSGRMYHLEDPSQLAGILDQEVRLLSSTVATGAYLEISAGPGVKVEGAEFADGRAQRGALRVKLGSIFAGQRREVLVRMKVRGAPGSEQDLARVRLVYRDRDGRGRWRAQSVTARARLGDDAKEAAASADPRVQALLARHEAAEAQRRAAAMLDAGRNIEAAAELARGEMQVQAAARRADDPAERARLTAQAARMSQSRRQYEQADTHMKKRAASLKSYGYSFSDDGLAAPPAPAEPPPAARVRK